LVLTLLSGLVYLGFGNLLGIVPLAAYLAGVAGLAVVSGGLSLKSRVALVIALPTIHLSWGAGFIFGLLRGASKTIDRSRVTK
jgi:hypothetical protein